MPHVTEAPTSAPFTKAEWDLLPEGFPAQLVEGWLVREPAPTYGHQRTVSRILFALLTCAPARCALAPCIGVFVDDQNVYIPDAMVLHEIIHDEDRDVHSARLVFEGLSPTARLVTATSSARACWSQARPRSG